MPKNDLPANCDNSECVLSKSVHCVSVSAYVGDWFIEMGGGRIRVAVLGGGMLDCCVVG